MKINAVKGFRDVLPGETELWSRLEDHARRVFRSYGFAEIRMPLLERTELFGRAAGETTDIVEKQMYTFEDVDGTSLTLRPEGTASVVRAYIEHGIYGREPVSKLFYSGAMFRRERPQKGRFRQFHQIGAEVLGRDDPLVDAELLVMLADYFAALGLATARLEINSLGDDTCRPGYRDELRRWAEAHRASLCVDCNRRLERNPLRILDCKEDAERTRDAPMMMDHLCAACAAHFAAVRTHLDAESVAYAVNGRMVRGLDYYCRTAFEIVADGLGAQNAIGGGGRYDGLVASLDGPSVAGIGFALGVERLVLALAGAEVANGFDLFVAPLGERAEARAFRLARELRRRGLRLEIEPGRRSLKSHLRRADKLGAAYALIVGDDELTRGRAVLRNLRNQSQAETSLDAAAILSVVRGGYVEGAP